jgi:hypothetical protein
MGFRVCHSLRTLIFEYEDVSYTAHNDAKGLTDGMVAAFAHACPNLTKVRLRGTCGLGDAALLAFFEHCPKLQVLEITAGSRSDAKITGSAFDTICQNPCWGAKVKQLLVTNSAATTSRS